MSLQVQFLYQPSEEIQALLESQLEKEISIGWGPVDSGDNAFDVLVAGRPTIHDLQASPRLHTLIIPFAGVPPETRELILEHAPELHVFNLHHNARATAEMALALLFAVAKQLIPADKALRRNDWRIRYQPSKNIILSDRRVLVLGYGAVGREIARISIGLGMSVQAVRRRVGEEEQVDGVHHYPLDALDRLLPETQVLFLSLPFTEQSKGLIDAKRISLLPKECILINVARGPIVDQEALYNALSDEKIAGAGIDVWYTYPQDEASRQDTPPSSFPFSELHNVVMSPHRGGGSRENESLRMMHLARVLNDLVNGREPPSRVDMIKGY
jgi:phosphoglycerate dehydrogenase-like enzyme